MDDSNNFKIYHSVSTRIADLYFTSKSTTVDVTRGLHCTTNFGNNELAIRPPPPKKKNRTRRGFGPRANYADRATAACWRSSANFCG
jgi:hypothetical protein